MSKSLSQKNLALNLPLLEIFDELEFSVAICKDKEIREYNASYRKKDKPTDVISFPSCNVLSEDPRILYGGSLGDIIISIDTVRRQAKEYGVSEEEEFLRVLVHGFLHLLGYDHENVDKQQAESMFKMQDKLIEICMSDA